jgi:hypothetical protein
VFPRCSPLVGGSPTCGTMGVPSRHTGLTLATTTPAKMQRGEEHHIAAIAVDTNNLVTCHDH